VVLLIAAPLLGVAIIMARRPGLSWHEETPESILRSGIVRADATLRAMRVGRWHIAVVAGFVAVLWLLQAVGVIDAGRFLIFYSLVCFVVSLGSWLWMRWRTQAGGPRRKSGLRAAVGGNAAGVSRRPHRASVRLQEGAR
jgi:hypothetical protein